MRRLLQGALLAVLLVVGYLNCQLFYSPNFSLEDGRPINQDVVAQLRFLRGPMHTGAGQQMQEIYPEGFVYLNALYALAWAELLPHLPARSTLYEEGLAEAGWAVREIQSPAGQAQFDSDLPLPQGAFYQGWSAYVLARYLAAQPATRRDTAQVRQFRQQCALIARVLQNSSTPYPESYAEAAWPADGVMGVAALAWHDRLYPSAYQPLIRQWVRNVQAHLDSRGLIPHRTGGSTGQVLEDARGSSQSQLLNFLVEIDPVFAHQQFGRYRHYFLTSRLGLPGIREAALGAPPTADVDSGPVIWDVGGAASLVGRRTMQRYADTTTAVGLRNSIETFGAAITTSTGKRYLFGQLPIADAFIAWANSVEATHEVRGAAGWRGQFQLLSALVAAVLVAGIVGLQRKQRPVR